MKHKSVIFLGISLIILAVMLYIVGIDNIISALEKADMYLILLAVVVQIFICYMYALRWHIINKVADIDVSIKNLLPMTFVGLAFNNITPAGRGGGEPVRAYILARDSDYPMEETFATVVADRALDTFPFIVLAILTIIGATFYFKIATWLIIAMIIAVIAIVAVLAILIYMVLNEKFSEKVSNFIISLLRRFYKKNSEALEKKVFETIAGFQDTLKLMLDKNNIAKYALPLSFIIWIFEILRVYIVFLAFGANISPIIIGEVFIMASLVGMIPALPGGIGAVDGIMIIFYSMAGISTSISAAATVVERLISFWMVTIIGMCIVPYYGKSVFDKISFNPKADQTFDEITDEFEDIGEDGKVFDKDYDEKNK
ncbi:MAG: UPF0104 family protein [Methanobrevibacter sp.]|uniref:UPF0104 family protein n=1 Tax=Methanobrevibacter sp. TaxID=66852 RepID=UPI0026DFF9F9|nr:UPF0104 family protein [Methanobrevibacter sp.]MDO5848056.1 UPF0104 family protein [Methanobrevibacter sp.]